MSTVAIERGVPRVADRHLPWASKVDVFDRPEWRTRHFWLNFENGWTLSVTFGSGTYGTNRDWGWSNQPWHEEAATVEIAAWPTGVGADGMIEWDDGDSVKGWVSAENLNRLIDQMMTWPSNPPEGFIARIEGES